MIQFIKYFRMFKSFLYVLNHFGAPELQLQCERSGAYLWQPLSLSPCFPALPLFLSFACYYFQPVILIHQIHQTKLKASLLSKRAFLLLCLRAEHSTEQKHFIHICQSGGFTATSAQNKLMTVAQLSSNTVQVEGRGRVVRRVS